MEDFLGRTVEQLVTRARDLLSFRFLIQPTVAIVLAIRAGRRDAARHRTGFLSLILTDRAARGMLLRDAWADIARLTAAAFVVDTVYQLAVLRWFYPLQAVIVAGGLALLPYVLVRGPVSRLARRGGVHEIVDGRGADCGGDRAAGRSTTEVPSQGAG